MPDALTPTPRAFGIRCPACGAGGRHPVYGTYHARNGRTVRYHTCPRCRTRFKSVQLTVADWLRPPAGE